MDEQDRVDSSGNPGNRKFVIVEIEDETPDFSEVGENAEADSAPQKNPAADTSIFGFEVTEEFWEENEAAPAESVTEKLPAEAPTEEAEPFRDAQVPEPVIPAPEEEVLSRPDEPQGGSRKPEDGFFVPTEPLREEDGPVSPFADFRLEADPELLRDFFTAEEETESEPVQPETVREPKRKIWRSIISWVLTVLVAFAIALVINIFLFRPSEVSGDSMVPTLHNEDTVILSRVPYFFGEPEHGDVVVIDSHVNNKRSIFTLFSEAMRYNVVTKLCGQAEPDYFWIKRVIGTAGDEISFSDNRLYRNGALLQEPYINESDVYNYPNGVSVTVPEGYVYVMGDNRNHSTDSRVIGIVPLENIIGKMIASW